MNRDPATEAPRAILTVRYRPGGNWYYPSLVDVLITDNRWALLGKFIRMPLFLSTKDEISISGYQRLISVSNRSQDWWMHLRKFMGIILHGVHI